MAEEDRESGIERKRVQLARADHGRFGTGEFAIFRPRGKDHRHFAARGAGPVRNHRSAMGRRWAAVADVKHLQAMAATAAIKHEND